MTASALRQFRLQPLYAFACISTLTLAVGASVVSFAVAKRAFLDPLPYPDGERIVGIKTLSDGRESGTMSIFVAEDLQKAGTAVLSEFAFIRFGSATFQGSDTTETRQAHEVTPAFFETFRTKPEMGAVWPSQDASSVIVSYRFWEQRLSADRQAIGRAITLDGSPRQIVGVMPQSFEPPFGAQVDFWIPLDVRPLLKDTARARRTVLLFARLSPTVSLEQASAYLATFSERQQATYPTIHARESWLARGLREDLIGPSDTVVAATGAAAGLLMLIVWANIAGLSSARAAAHRQHHAIRTALGAGAWRLFRERLIDSLTLSLVGSLAGVALGYALVRLATRYQPQFLPAMQAITFDAPTALLGMVLGMMTGLFAALAPHAAIARLQSGDPLRSSRTATADTRLTSLRSVLVLVQVAVAIVLIAAAGLLVRTVLHLSSTSLGFATGQLISFNVTLPLPAYRESAKQVRFEQELLDRISTLPGVRGASASVGFPVMGSMGARLWILGQPQTAAPPDISYFSVTPNFFSFIGVPLREGRDIAPTDDFPAPRAVVINETMARMFWPEGNALGATVKIGAGAATDREITVVGIAADVRQHGPTQRVAPAAYGSTLQYSWPRRNIAVRVEGQSASLAQDLRAAVRAVDTAVASSAVTAIDDVVSQQTARHRLVMMTLTFYGAVATILCGFGIYAVIALTSHFRRREYAIRAALGLTRGGIHWMVVRQALVLAVIGAVAGLAAATVATRTLQGLLHGVTPVDTLTFAVAAVAVLLLAAVSACVPAWRAGRISTVEMLRAE